jgi:hypothetical protein
MRSQGLPPSGGTALCNDTSLYPLTAQIQRSRPRASRPEGVRRRGNRSPVRQQWAERFAYLRTWCADPIFDQATLRWLEVGWRPAPYIIRHFPSHQDEVRRPAADYSRAGSYGNRRHITGNTDKLPPTSVIPRKSRLAGQTTHASLYFDVCDG